MRHILFSDPQDTYSIAVLIKDTAFNAQELWRHYLDAVDIPAKEFIGFSLNSFNGKITASKANEYLEELLPELKALGVVTIYCADATYFKQLTKEPKAEALAGYVVPCRFPDYEHFNVIFGLNYGALIHNPNLYDRLKISLDTLEAHYKGLYRPPGTGVVLESYYPRSEDAIKKALKALLDFPVLVCDLETFSLNPFQAGVGTIAFCHAEGMGTAFSVDWYSGSFTPNQSVRNLLKEFFCAYKGRLVFHNSAFDIKVLIATLWMEHPKDFSGMLAGLEVLTRDFVDTKILAYVNLNTTSRAALDLKSLTQDYLGNYALDNINDIRKVPLDQLLEYNLMDTLGTWFLYKKFYQEALTDSKDITELLHKTTKWVIQAELVGMPIDMSKVKKAKSYLVGLQFEHMAALSSFFYVQKAEHLIKQAELAKINSKLKTRQYGMERVQNVVFNPNSNKHLAVLLHDVMELPVLDTTPTGEPATGADTLNKLTKKTNEEAKLEVLSRLIGLAGVSKILSAFIPAFEQATVKEDGMGWLHASFNVTGTVSGRMSCSNPNLQQIPSGSGYGKLIKSCFVAPKGWLFCGADFNALEDKINTILTDDPNKLKIWIDGYDGHCYRAFYYFKDQMPDIVDTVESVNSIKSKYPHLRNDSKAPSFALQYAGTWTTLVKNCGFTEEQAKSIEANYHKMYEVSGRWVQSKLEECSQQGYTRVAFGLKIRTPLLARTVLNTSKTPKEAQAEARSVGNAISGQSYGLLTNRAAVAFMERVQASPYKHSVFLVSMIHDAIYLLVKDDLDTVTWVNQALIEEMQWQELPEIKHDKLKLSAELDIYYEGWHKPITLPNNLTREQVYRHCHKPKE